MNSKICFAVMFLILLTTRLFAFGASGIGGTMIPHPKSQVRNPAYVLYPENWGYGGGVGIPLGLLGLSGASRNPLNYLTDPGTFQSSFDLLSFYDQLSHPMEFLLNPAESTDEVFIGVTASGITITDEDGRPIDLNSINGSSNIAVGGTALIPPQVVGFPWKAGPLYFSSGIFIGGGGSSLELTGDLNQVLDLDSLSFGDSYTVSGTASFLGGISQHITLPFLFSSPSTGIDGYFAVRMVFYYLLLYGEFSFSAGTTGGAESLPSGGNFESSYFYLYPGKGAGGGGRIDAGFVLKRRDFTIGLGILNLAGFSGMSGYGSDELSFSDLAAGAEKTDRYNYDFLPVITLNTAYAISMGFGHILLAGDLGYLQNVSAHAGIGMFTANTFFKWGAGWENQFRWSSGLGIRIKKIWFEFIVTGHQAPFTQEHVLGLALNIGISDG